MLGFASKRVLIFLASSLVFVMLIVFGNSITPPNTPNTRPEIAYAPPHNAPPDASDIIGNPITAETIPSGVNFSRPNLTDTIASLIGKSIALKNPEGPKEGVLTVEETEEIANEALTASLDTSIISRLTPSDSEIPVIIDGATDELSYRARVDLAIGETAGVFVPDTTLPIRAQMTALSETYGAMARKLAIIPAPARLADLHRGMIRSATVKQRAFAAVAEYDTDPVYALLAIKTIKETK